MEYIESLRVFCSLVEAKSFTRTADMLGHSTAVVSRALTGLEQRLGVRLLNRSTRQVSLTEAAEHFYAGCVRLLAELDALEESASRQAREPTGLLRIVAHANAATPTLVPLISAFNKAHPSVTVDVTCTEGPVDLVAEGFDVGFLLPYMQTSEMVVTRLLERIPLRIVASPTYLRKHGLPKHPDDLSDHRFVGISNSIRKPILKFRIATEVTSVPVTHEVISNSAPFNLGLVREGLGIGVLPNELIQQDLASGKLVPILDTFEFVDVETELRLAYVTRTLLPAKTRAFIDHAVEFFRIGSRGEQQQHFEIVDSSC